jgi:hypothetical protein
LIKVRTARKRNYVARPGVEVLPSGASSVGRQWRQHRACPRASQHQHPERLSVEPRTANALTSLRGEWVPERNAALPIGPRHRAPSPSPRPKCGQAGQNAHFRPYPDPDVTKHRREHRSCEEYGRRGPVSSVLVRRSLEPISASLYAKGAASECVEYRA